MKHLEFMFNGRKFSLTGDCITVFSKCGDKVSHKFFGSHDDAKKAFLELYDTVQRG